MIAHASLSPARVLAEIPADADAALPRLVAIARRLAPTSPDGEVQAVAEAAFRAAHGRTSTGTPAAVEVPDVPARVVLSRVFAALRNDFNTPAADLYEQYRTALPAGAAGARWGLTFATFRLAYVVPLWDTFFCNPRWADGMSPTYPGYLWQTWRGLVVEGELRVRPDVTDHELLALVNGEVENGNAGAGASFLFASQMAARQCHRSLPNFKRTFADRARECVDARPWPEDPKTWSVLVPAWSALEVFATSEAHALEIASGVRRRIGKTPVVGRSTTARKVYEFGYFNGVRHPDQNIPTTLDATAPAVAFPASERRGPAGGAGAGGGEVVR